MVKKISFIIIMSFALTGCSVFSKEEETEQVDAYEELLSSDTSDLGTDVGINPLGEETQAVDPLTGETLSFNELADVEDDTVQQPQNNSYILPPYAVGSVTLVDNPQTVQDIRYNFMIRGKLEPAWKIGNFSLEGQQQTTDSSGNSAPTQVTGKEVKDMISKANEYANTKDAVILLQTDALVSNGMDNYYCFSVLPSTVKPGGEVTNCTYEKQESVGGKTVKTFTVSAESGDLFEEKDGKHYVNKALSGGEYDTNYDSGIIAAEGHNCYISDDMKFSMEILYNKNMKDQTGNDVEAGYLYKEIKEQQ